MKKIPKNIDKLAELEHRKSYQEQLIGHNGPMINVFGDPDKSKYWGEGEWMMIDNRVCGLEP